MAKHFILADDLTGSNATAALLHASGVPVITVVHSEFIDAKLMDGPESIVCNSGTRLLTPELASARVATIVSGVLALSQDHPPTFAKRIDSTLRGPLGQEIEAFLSKLPSSTVAVMVPSYPSSGRTVLEGMLYVHGVPLHLTEMNQDPFHPIRSSHVREILQQQTQLPSTWITTGPDLSLCDAIVTAIQSGARIIGCDAASFADIEHVAMACVKASEVCAVSILPVDPGPFTTAFFNHREGISTQALSRKVLVVSASLMGTAKRQLERLLMDRDGACFPLDARRLNDDESAAHYFANLTPQLLEASLQHDLVVLRTDTERVTTGDASNLVSSIGKLVNSLMSQVPFHGLYVSGGETAAHILTSIGAHALKIVREVEPLCVLSTVVGGPLNGLRVVTKGGGVGSDTVLVKSVDALLS